MIVKTDRLGPRERHFLASIAGSGKRIFRLEDAIPYWPSRHLARKALSRLESKGWLERLERGLYLVVPLEAGPEGQWSEDPLVIATQMVPYGATAYWTALNYWGMTEQVPRIIYIQTSRRRSQTSVTILGVQYQMVVIVERKLFGITTQMSDGLSFRITDREKTLVDSCDRPDLCGGIFQVAEALRLDEPLDWEKVDIYLEKFDSGAVYKRLGYLVEALGITVPDRAQKLRQWRNKLTHGIALLEPGAGHEGSINTSWRIRENVEV
jgi:predicted transcriptional regulator of viral defense system